MGFTILSFCADKDEVISFSLTQLLVFSLHAFALFVSVRDQPQAFCSEKLRVVPHTLNVYHIGLSTQLRTAVWDGHRFPLVVR